MSPHDHAQPLFIFVISTVNTFLVPYLFIYCSISHLKLLFELYCIFSNNFQYYKYCNGIPMITQCISTMTFTLYSEYFLTY